jgi:NAD(P)-dependent dehydrogenase (short-subunit alcohol dehydrogenase family)
MSKIGINALTQIQQKEIDQDTTRTGIIVSAVCPGYCKTEMTGGGGFFTAEQGSFKFLIKICC